MPVELPQKNGWGWGVARILFAIFVVDSTHENDKFSNKNRGGVGCHPCIPSLDPHCKTLIEVKQIIFDSSKGLINLMKLGIDKGLKILIPENSVYLLFQITFDLPLKGVVKALYN